MNAILATIKGTNIIAINGTMPWHLDDSLRELRKFDMNFFKETTMGGDLLMGRVTWDSLGRKKLKGRNHHYVVTSKGVEGMKYWGGYQDEEHQLFYLQPQMVTPLFFPVDDDNLYLMGGKRMYDGFLSDCRVIYWNEIEINNQQQWIASHSGDIVKIEHSLESLKSDYDDIVTEHQFSTGKVICHKLIKKVE